MKLKILTLYLVFLSFVLPFTRWHTEIGKVYTSSYYNHNYYAVVVCKHGLMLGLDTPKLYTKGQEIILEWRNTNIGIQHRVKEM